MLRRGISLLLLLGFIAGQLAAVPHAHGVSNAAGHDEHPHIHLTWFNHDHAHGDEHHHHRPPATQGPAVGMDGDHDSDAIYFSTTVVTPRIGGRDFTVVKLAVVGSLDPAVPTCLHVDHSQAGSTQSSRMSAPACALYLTLRALRI